MIKVGITGGIGSGKTFISQVFEKLGVSVYYADEEAKKLYYLPEIKNQIVDLLGNDAYLNEKIDTRYISSVVFSNENKLNALNQIIHPAVKTHFESWISEHEHEKYILKEAAILFETGGYKNFDKIILVTAPEQLRIKRIQKREHSNIDEIMKRIAMQWSDEKKSALSDFIITNDEKHLLLPQILKIHQAIIN